MKVEAPFLSHFYKSYPFFNEIKDDIISIIYDIHKQAPFEVWGSFPKGKHIKIS